MKAFKFTACTYEEGWERQGPKVRGKKTLISTNFRLTFLPLMISFDPTNYHLALSEIYRMALSTNRSRRQSGLTFANAPL